MIIYIYIYIIYFSDFHKILMIIMNNNGIYNAHNHRMFNALRATQITII